MKEPKQFTIISENTHFTQISNQITKNKKLSDFAIRLYGYLKSHNESFFLSYRTIANYLNISESKVKRGIKELKQSGFIKLEQIENKNQYRYILFNSPKNKEYAILNEIEENGLNLSLYDIKDIYNILNDKEITQETKDKIKEKLNAIIHTNWID